MHLKLIATILLFYYLKTQGFSLFRNSKIVFEHLYYLFRQPFLQFVNLRCLIQFLIFEIRKELFFQQI